MIRLRYLTMITIFSLTMCQICATQTKKETTDRQMAQQTNDPGRSANARLEILQAVSSTAVSSITLQHHSSLLTAAMIRLCNGPLYPPQRFQPLQPATHAPCVLTSRHNARRLANVGGWLTGLTPGSSFLATRSFTSRLSDTHFHSLAPEKSILCKMHLSPLHPSFQYHAI